MLKLTKIRIIWCLVIVITVSFEPVHIGVQTWRILTGEGILGMVAGQSLLIKDGSLSANKAVLVHSVQLPIVVVHGVADVENLTVIQSVSIVSIASILLIAVKTIIVRSIKKSSSRSWETLDSVGIFFILILVFLSHDTVHDEDGGDEGCEVHDGCEDDGDDGVDGCEDD